MKTDDNDTYYVFGNKVSSREVEQLEDMSGKTSIAGEMIRLHDAVSELEKVVVAAFVTLIPRRWR